MVGVEIRDIGGKKIINICYGNYWVCCYIKFFYYRIKKKGKVVSIVVFVCKVFSSVVSC